jgi:TolB-like protein
VKLWTTLATMLAACVVGGCASSVVVPPIHTAPYVALLPLEGPQGEQTADLLSQALARSGVSVVPRDRLQPLLAVETELDPTAPTAMDAYRRYGAALHVRYILSGRVSARQAPLAAFPHVDIELRLIDVQMGQTRWIGHYGDPIFSRALSAEGDLRQGVGDLADAFTKAAGQGLWAQ